MDFAIEQTAEGWVLTVGDTHWVYPTLKKVFNKIKTLLLAANSEE